MQLLKLVLKHKPKKSEMTMKKKTIKPRDPASYLKTAGALRTIAFTPKSLKIGRKAKHKKEMSW